MVWNQLADIRTPQIVTTDFLYIRFIGGDSALFSFYDIRG